MQCWISEAGCSTDNSPHNQWLLQVCDDKHAATDLFCPLWCRKHQHLHQWARQARHLITCSGDADNMPFTYMLSTFVAFSAVFIISHCTCCVRKRMLRRFMLPMQSSMCNSFGRICLYVCMYVCQMITFDCLPWRRKSIFAHAVYLHCLRIDFVYKGHWVKAKVTEAKKVENSYSHNVKLRSARTSVRSNIEPWCLHAA